MRSVVTTVPTCLSGATQISWNAHGPSGANGLPGATGPQGSVGQAGICPVEALSMPLTTVRSPWPGHAGCTQADELPGTDPPKDHESTEIWWRYVSGVLAEVTAPGVGQSYLDGRSTMLA